MEYDPLKPDQEVNDRRSTLDRLILGFLVIALVFCFVLAFTISAGCVTLAKNTAYGMLEESTPEPTMTITEIPTPSPLPTPEPTIDIRQEMVSTNGYYLREWLHWYRPDVDGLKDLSTWTTVYDFRFFDRLHFWSVSWNRPMIEMPETGMKYLLVYINTYTDGDNVRQWLFRNYIVISKGVAYYPEEVIAPEARIVELDDSWDYAHVQSPRAFGYRIKQEAVSGIITAERIEKAEGGRSNAVDGYLIFQVPYDTQADDVKVWGSFANLGGNAWWKLV